MQTGHSFEGVKRMDIKCNIDWWFFLLYPSYMRQCSCREWIPLHANSIFGANFSACMLWEWTGQNPFFWGFFVVRSGKGGTLRMNFTDLCAPSYLERHTKQQLEILLLVEFTPEMSLGSIWMWEVEVFLHCAKCTVVSFLHYFLRILVIPGHLLGNCWNEKENFTDVPF